MTQEISLCQGSRVRKLTIMDLIADRFEIRMSSEQPWQTAGSITQDRALYKDSGVRKVRIQEKIDDRNEIEMRSEKP
jgi:hypothetical protein